MFRKPVSLSLVWYIATDAKCAHIAFKVLNWQPQQKYLLMPFLRTILKWDTVEKALPLVVSCICIFSPVAYGYAYAMKVTMAMMLIAIIDFALPSCSLVMDGSRGSVQISCYGVVHSWAATFVM